MQSTNNIILIRPSGFVFNSETALSNAFQNLTSETPDEIKKKVQAEFEAFAATLISKGINVHVFDDTVVPPKPDAVFPNNWISLHGDGTVILYPMCAPNRRQERRLDIIKELKKTYQVYNIVDLSHYEKENRFLEGTGSIVFDHKNKRAYACLSPRTDKVVFEEVCRLLKYKPVHFYAHDERGKEIYHTNVMMCIGGGFAVICLSSISDESERKGLINSLEESGHRVIDISFDQMNHFAGNMLELKIKSGENIVVLSKTAFDSLSPNQRREIENFSKLVPLAIPTIETIGGGSVRCMIAEVFLKSFRLPKQPLLP